MTYKRSKKASKIHNKYKYTHAMIKNLSGTWAGSYILQFCNKIFISPNVTAYSIMTHAA